MGLFKVSEKEKGLKSLYNILDKEQLVLIDTSMVSPNIAGWRHEILKKPSYFYELDEKLMQEVMTDFKASSIMMKKDCLYCRATIAAAAASAASTSPC